MYYFSYQQLLGKDSTTRLNHLIMHYIQLEKQNNITICPCSDKAPLYPSLQCSVLTRCEFCVPVAQSCLTLLPHGLQPARLLCPWHFQGKNTGVSCHFLLQGIFQTQGLNPGLWCCRQILYCLSQQGSPLYM